MVRGDRCANFYPPDWLTRWIDDIPRGRALDIGAGSGQLTRWLAQRGFQVKAIEPDSTMARRLIKASSDLDIDVVRRSIQTVALPESHYTLIVAGAVLHFLLPPELPEIGARLSHALKPGGYLMAEVFTGDDPGLERYRRSDVDPVEENTYPLLEREGVIHFFAPGELRRLFSDLEMVEYEESRRADPDDEAGFRAGASLVARKPEQA